MTAVVASRSTRTAGTLESWPTGLLTTSSGAYAEPVTDRWLRSTNLGSPWVFAAGQMVEGTGSVLTDYLVRLAGTRCTGSNARVVVLHNKVALVDPLRPISEAVITIRDAFTLSVTDLAAVLGVERPTIYSWLKDQSTPAASRAERIALILNLARTWLDAREGASGPALASEVAEGVDLRTALREPLLWRTEIERNLMAQAAAPQARPSRRNLVSAARENGIGQRSTADFDIATGRPLAPES